MRDPCISLHSALIRIKYNTEHASMLCTYIRQQSLYRIDFIYGSVYLITSGINPEKRNNYSKYLYEKISVAYGVFKVVVQYASFFLNEIYFYNDYNGLFSRKRIFNSNYHTLCYNVSKILFISENNTKLVKKFYKLGTWIVNAIEH